jgi:hypothetical protein
MDDARIHSWILKDPELLVLHDKIRRREKNAKTNAKTLTELHSIGVLRSELKKALLKRNYILSSTYGHQMQARGKGELLHFHPGLKRGTANNIGVGSSWAPRPQRRMSETNVNHHKRSARDLSDAVRRFENLRSIPSPALRGVRTVDDFGWAEANHWGTIDAWDATKLRGFILSKLQPHVFLARAILLRSLEIAEDVYMMPAIDFSSEDMILPYDVLPALKKRRRFVLVPVGRSFPDLPAEAAHANMLIIDSKMMTAELFDPYGSGEWDPDMYVPLLRALAKQHPFLRVISPSAQCPIGGGPQAIVDGPYCIAWAALYAAMRIHNPDVPGSMIVDMMVNLRTQVLHLMLVRFIGFMQKISMLSVPETRAMLDETPGLAERNPELTATALQETFVFFSDIPKDTIWRKYVDQMLQPGCEKWLRSLPVDDIRSMLHFFRTRQEITLTRIVMSLRPDAFSKRSQLLRSYPAKKIK